MDPTKVQIFINVQTKVKQCEICFVKIVDIIEHIVVVVETHKFHHSIVSEVLCASLSSLQDFPLIQVLKKHVYDYRPDVNACNIIEALSIRKDAELRQALKAI